MRRSSRGEVDPFIVMDVMEAARAAEAAGRDIVHMEVGQPGTGAPEAATARLAEAMRSAPLGYSVALGLPDLRARIARLYADRHGVEVDPGRVVVTAGASGAFLLSFTALFETGARVGLARPGYPSYRQILRALDYRAIDLPTAVETRFQPQPGDVAAHRLDGLLVASPANPTGSMLARQELAALSDACRDRQAGFISDEIYQGIGYGRAPVSALEVTQDVHVVNSFSKYWSMTGWRVGWMIVPEDHVRAVERLAQNMFICASHAGQVLALHALDCEEACRANVGVYARNRAVLMQALAQIGWPVAPPDGAFYLYADVSGVTEDSRRLAAEILRDAGVAVTPGLDFDPVDGHRWVRLSYARGEAEIADGAERLVRHFTTVSV